MNALVGSVIRASVNLGCFFAAFAACALTIHRLLPFPDIYAVQAKVAWLAQHPDDYDTIFIGTSRIYHQLIPSIFDKLTAERGVPTKSFNAAVDGMRPPEDAYVLDEILKSPHPRLRWVFLESGAVRVAVDPRKRGTNRNVYWHDGERLATLWSEGLQVRKESKHLRNKIRDFLGSLSLDLVEHTGLYLQNMSNFGRASSPLQHWLHPHWPAIYWPPLGPQQDGFARIADRTQLQGKALLEFRAAMTSTKKRPPVEDYGSQASQAAMQTMLLKITAAKATPVLLIPPTLSYKNFRPKPDAQPPAPVFNFSDLNKYPELYNEPVRLDTDHLNTAGAEIFTRLVADRFAEWAHANP